MFVLILGHYDTRFYTEALNQEIRKIRAQRKKVQEPLSASASSEQEISNGIASLEELLKSKSTLNGQAVREEVG